LDLISRADAKAQGLKRYCTGDPCKHGHVAERLVSDYACVECSRLKAIRERPKRKEYARVHMRKYRENHGDKVRATLRKCYRKHREKRLEEKRQKYLENPEQAKLTLRLSYEKHKEARAEGMRRYRNREDKKQLISVLKRSYKAKKKGAEGRHTVEDINALFAAQSGKCLCGEDLNNGYHVDHIVPLSAGGTNWPDNLQLLCPTCNLSKGSKPMSEWLALRGLHLERA
jgi:5-methylcytosine-specific restriction endonuclease McrA